MARHHSNRRSTPGGPGGRLKWLAVALGAAFLIYVALQIYLRYGAADTTQAGTMIYGMLLFLFGTVLLALVAVVLVKLIARFARRGSKSLFDTFEE